MKLETFGNTAKGLTKNPISLIGLFLVLVYAIASLVISSNNFEKTERLILILFLVIFPFAVLFVFYKLVTQHHNKLYAPSDYKDESNFIKSIDFGFDPIVEKVKLKRKDLKNIDNKTPIIDWDKYNISINKLLSNSAKICDVLIDNGVSTFNYFQTEKPDYFTLTFTKQVSVESVKLLIKLLLPLGLDSIRYTPKDKLKKKDFYIGSMAYKYEQPIARLEKGLVDRLIDDSISIEKMIELVEMNSKVL